MVLWYYGQGLLGCRDFLTIFRYYNMASWIEITSELVSSPNPHNQTQAVLAIIMRLNFTNLFIIASTLLSIVLALPVPVPKDQSLYVYLLVYITMPIYLVHPAPNTVLMLEAMLSPLSLVDLKLNPMSYLTEISRISSDVREKKAQASRGIHRKSLSAQQRGRILTILAYTEKRGGKQRSITRR